MSRVFLGGTCAESTWREELIPLLNTDVGHFNPVVTEWTDDCRDDEERAKVDCDIHLFVITNDAVGGSVYSIAEAVESAFNKDKVTILQVVDKGMVGHQIRALTAVCDLLEKQGAFVYMGDDLAHSAALINISADLDGGERPFEEDGKYLVFSSDDEETLPVVPTPKTLCKEWHDIQRCGDVEIENHYTETTTW